MNFFCLSSKFGIWVVSANLCLSSPLGETGYTMYVVHTPEALYLSVYFKGNVYIHSFVFMGAFHSWSSLWCREKDRIGHFTVTCRMPWPVNRLEVTMFSYKPSCFSHVNDYVHRLITLRITWFAHEEQKGL